MKTEEQIIDEVYENEVFRIVNVYFGARLKLPYTSVQEHEENFKSGLLVAGSIRDRAKELLKEVSK